MLELKDIKKSYGPVKAVDGVDLTLDNGELMVILGPSGCGKTTLLRLIAGFEQPDSGFISIDGEVVSSRDTMIPPNRRKLGMIFQDLALWPHMSVKQNIAFGLKGKGIKRDKREEKIREAIRLVQLSGNNHLDRYPHQLSGGERQRVAIARTISLEPETLLMDEPLSNLDPDLKGQIREVILDLKKKLSLSIIYVTHDHEDALALADTVVIMNQGRIEHKGESTEIMRKVKQSGGMK